MNDVFVIDQKLGISVNYSKYSNEINALIQLKTGMILLYNNVRPTEKNIEEKSNGSIHASLGRDPLIPEFLFALLPCFFHWYGTSICNYARLIGFIVGRETGKITDTDVEYHPNMDAIKNFCDKYMRELDELKEVLKWRNKVFGHFALTDPRKDDNIATLEASIIFPVSIKNNRFYTGFGIWNFEKIINSQNSIESKIPTWSLTETFELLAKRYWSDIISDKKSI